MITKNSLDPNYQVCQCLKYNRKRKSPNTAENRIFFLKSVRSGKISGSVKLHIGDSWDKPEMHKCPRINVLSVTTHKFEMEPRMGDGEK